MDSILLRQFYVPCISLCTKSLYQLFCADKTSINCHIFYSYVFERNIDDLFYSYCIANRSIMHLFLANYFFTAYFHLFQDCGCKFSY